MGKLKSLGVVDIVGQKKRAPFAGRLRLFNTNITKDQWVIQAINRYRIDWCGRPHQYNDISERRGSKMTRKGAVEIVHRHPEDGFHSNRFLVPKKDGGQRPVINLKFLNSFVQPHHFKMEGILVLKDIMKQ